MKYFQVLTVIFQYLDMLRRVGPQKWVYEEIRTIEENEFRWQEQVGPLLQYNSYATTWFAYLRNILELQLILSAPTNMAKECTLDIYTTK